MSDKKSQILILSPSNDLVFKGPFSEVVTSTLTLQNPTEASVIFKVKTTAPKHYCVRPNSGVLAGLESVVISVMLQPMDGESVNRAKHKFMVQTMMAPPGFQSDKLDAVWSQAGKGETMDSKLQCVFIEGAPAGSTGTSVPARSSSAEDPVPADETPSPLPSSGSKQDYQVQEVPEVAPPSSTESSVAPSSSAGESTSAVEKATVDAQLRVLQNKLDELTNTNKQLQSDNTKLRQRFTPGGGAMKGTGPISVAKADQLASPKRHLSLVAIMLILVAIVLGYLVGKWL